MLYSPRQRNALLKGGNFLRKAVFSSILGAGFLILLWWTFFTPEGSLRWHIGRHFGAYQALTVDFEQTGFSDPVYGVQFMLKGLQDPETGMDLNFAYLKKEKLGWWIVTSVGTGP